MEEWFGKELFILLENAKISQFPMCFSIYWICILIASVAIMAMIFMDTLKDYFDGEVITKFDTIELSENHTFPGVSICIKRSANKSYNNGSAEKFIQKYYSEHNLKKPGSLPVEGT